MIIYRIFNKINQKSYIGQSVNKFNTRYKGNKWWKLTHNEILKNSILKHGIENFDFEILEDNVSSIDELNKLEYDYALKFNSYRPYGYNIRGCGENKFMDDELKTHLSSFRLGTKYIPKNKKSSQYKGVKWCEDRKTWKCSFNNRIIKKSKNAKSELEAAEIYDKISLFLYGTETFLNFEDKRTEYLNSNLEDFYNSFISTKPKNKDNYYKDDSELLDKIKPLINKLSANKIAIQLNTTARKVNWCIKKHNLKT
jgi:hypothetical protein